MRLFIGAREVPETLDRVARKAPAEVRRERKARRFKSKVRRDCFSRTDLQVHLKKAITMMHSQKDPQGDCFLVRIKHEAISHNETPSHQESH